MPAREGVEQPVLQRLQQLHAAKISSAASSERGGGEAREQSPHSLRRRQISPLSAAWFRV